MPVDPGCGRRSPRRRSAVRGRPAIRWSLLASLLVATATPVAARQDDPGHPATSLTAEASDPTAPLLQLQVTNFVMPSSYNGEGVANLLQFQPVVPVPRLSWLPFAQVMRLTVPFLTTPGPGSVTGLADISFFDVLVPRAHSWGILGFGLAFVFPTATDDVLGAGKWQVGPAFTAMYYGISDWQIGAVVQNPISFAGDADRPAVNALLFQPIVNYLAGAWYIGVGDFTWQFDWENGGEVTLPLALQVGRVTRIGAYDYNLSVELEYTALHPEASVYPKWGLRFGVVLLLPEG